MNNNFENNEFFQQLPEETKEKIRNCKTEEEAMEVLKGDMIPIPDDSLDAVAGGGLYTCTEQSDEEYKKQVERCPGHGGY